MRVPYGEGLANHTGPESCGGDRKVVVEALTGVRAGWVSSLEIFNVRSADGLRPSEGNTGRVATARSKTPCTHAGTSLGRRSPPAPRTGTWRRKPGDPVAGSDELRRALFEPEPQSRRQSSRRVSFQSAYMQLPWATFTVR